MTHSRHKPTIWKLPRNRKAVSTVISTILMTTLAIMMGTLVVFWASQTLGTYQGSAGVFFTNRGAALKESFVVEDIWFYSSNKVNVTIRNVGAIEIKIVAVYLNSTSYTVSETITVGQSKTITFTLSQTYVSTSVYFFIIATARGNKVTEFWKASN